MFDIGFLELLVVAVVALIVLGPERLPVAIKVSAAWVRRLRRSFQSIREEIEKEINADDIRRDIHNESVMDDLKKTRDGLQKEIESINRQINEADKPALSDSPPSAEENRRDQTDSSGSKTHP